MSKEDMKELDKEDGESRCRNEAVVEMVKRRKSSRNKMRRRRRSNR